MAWAAVIGGGAALLGGVVAAKGAKSAAQSAADSNQAQIEANKLDPRVTNMLYGPDGTTGSGLIDQFKGLLDKPQLAGQKIYGGAGDNYIGKFGAYDFEQQRDASNRLMGGNTAAPQIAFQGVKAPAQNDINLKPAFERFINGAPGANPFLTKGIASGIDMSKAAFKQQQDDSTENLMKNILPSIGSASILSGQYGGSRQGIAEGNAIGQQQKELQRSLTNFGLGNTQSAVGAQSGAYETDSNRALAATQGLSQQQYGKASEDARMQMQVAMANQGAQMGTNQLNQAGTVAGIGANQSILGNAYQVAGNQDQYDVNKAGQVNGLLSPYLSKNPVPTNLQPVYSNTGSAAMGGAMAGLGMYNQLKQASGTPAAAPNWGQITTGYQNGTGY